MTNSARLGQEFCRRKITQTDPYSSPTNTVLLSRYEDHVNSNANQKLVLEAIDLIRGSNPKSDDCFFLY